MNSFIKFLCIILLVFLPCNAAPDTHVEIPVISPDDVEPFPVDFRKKFLFRSKPIIASYWSKKPDIRLCLGSGVTELRLQQATSFWERLGYEFGNIYVDDRTQHCFIGGNNNEIVIMLVNSDIEIGGKLAVTRTYYIASSREIVKSQIYIHKFASKKERVLEHEIGHALGWVHFNQSYHLMHANYNRGGHTTSGLKRSVYLYLMGEIIESLEDNN